MLNVPTTGSFSLTEDLNTGGTLSTQTITGMYTVDSSGRVLLTQTGMTTPSTAIYLVGPNQGFVASTGSSVDAGFVEPQVGAPFSNTSLSATYLTGTTNQVNQNVTDRSGQANFDPRDRVTGTMDDASIGPTPSTASLSPAQNFAYTYMLTNVVGTLPGRGTINTGTTTTIFYIISHHCLATCTSKIVLMDGTTNPALTIGETR